MPIIGIENKFINANSFATGVSSFGSTIFSNNNPVEVVPVTVPKMANILSQK
jgi:hypothetical protein